MLSEPYNIYIQIFRAEFKILVNLISLQGNASMNESVNILVPLRELSAYILTCRSKLEEALELFLCSLLIFIVINVILFYVVHNFRKGKSKFRFCRASKLPENGSRVLLVTAHPDDECMFFAPSLIGKFSS